MNLPPAPAREAFSSQEDFEEAMGFWQSRVGRLKGMRGVTLTVPSKDSPATSPATPPAPGPVPEK